MRPSPTRFLCDYCGKTATEKPSHFARSKRHFCNQFCYSGFRRDLLPKNEQPAWRGGVSPAEAHRRWVAKNPQRMAHLKARRYARERGAQGSHTFGEWLGVIAKHNGRCAHCGEIKPLTKDHIIPLALGGTDNISNIQPLCRNCNSRKWIKTSGIYENADLLKKEAE